MTSEENGLSDKNTETSNFFNFSSVIVDGLLDTQVELHNNNQNTPNSCAAVQNLSSCQVDGDVVEGLPRATFPGKCSRTFEALGEKEDESDNDSEIEEYFHSTYFDKNRNGNDEISDANATSSTTPEKRYYANFVSDNGSSSSKQDETLITEEQQQQTTQDNPQSYLEIQSTSSLTSSLSSCWSSGTTELLLLNNSANTTPRSGYSDWEATTGIDQQGTSLESTTSSWTVSFLTEIEVKPRDELISAFDYDDGCDVTTVQNDQSSLLSLTLLNMETSESGEKIEKEKVAEEGDGSTEVKKEEEAGGDQENPEGEKPSGEQPGDPEGEKEEDEKEEGDAEEDEGADEEEGGMEGDGFEGEDDDDDTTTLSSEAVVDDIELILMPEMCQDMPSQNLSPKLVRVTELKLNADDVFCDDDETDEDQSSRHEFRSIVEGEEDECHGAGLSQRDVGATGRVSFGDDDISSGSELVSGGRRIGVAGESSKSSSSSAGGRRRRSTSGRINSGAQTDITAVEEPTPLSSGHGYRKKSSGKGAAGRLGIPGGANGKKLNWKSELTLLPSKMKVKQSGFNSFESNDERDQYSPRVAKFTSQDTLNLSSQFLKPSTLYRTRNLSRNLNQFASSESTFMLPMSSEQQLSSCDVGESPRFRDRVSSSTSTAGGIGGALNFKGAATSYSAYQISSMLSGSNSGAGGGVGLGTPLSSARLARHPHNPGHNQPFISGGGGLGHMMMLSSRHFRSSMPDLNAVNRSYATVAAANMADSHRRRQPSSSSKSIKHSGSRHRHPHHHSSTGGGGFRLQKRSSSDEETSSLIDESERCLRSSIDLLLTDELPSPGGDSCFRFSQGFGGSTAANVGGPGGFYSYSSRRSCSQPILNDQAYSPDMKDPSMGSPFLPRKLSDMRCSRWAKVILPNGHVAVVSVKETDEIQDSLTVHTDTGCVINLPFRKVVFAWRSSSSSSRR